MEQDIFLDSPEPSQHTGAKRPPAFSAFGREAKRPCTQPRSSPAEIEISQWSHEQDSWGEFNVASNAEFGDTAFQYGIDSQTEWNIAIPSPSFGGLLSDSQHPTSTPSPYLFDYVPAQMGGVNMESRPEVDRLYQQLEIDSYYPLDMKNETIAPCFEVAHGSNVSYGLDFSKSGTDLAPTYFPPMEPLDDDTSGWIAGTADRISDSECQSLDLPESYELEITATAHDGQGALAANLEETILLGDKDTSEYLSTEIDHNKVLPDSTSKCLVFDPTQIDTCFGMIIAHTTSSWTGSQGTKAAPVVLRPFGDVMKLGFQDGKYAGILALPVLCKVKETSNIDYTATLVTSASGKDQRIASAKVKTPGSTHDCSVRILVHGVRSEGRSIGLLLSDAGLYLQHPSAAEIYRNVDYWNPHYLLRPGSQMPKLGSLSISPDTSSAITTKSMDETHQSLFMQVFNSANGSSSLVNPTPSPRLKSALKDHQATALAMMIERECGFTKNAQFASLWNPVDPPGPTVQYRHKVTGICDRDPKLFYGGILADEMGLGKTLSLLALVCSSLDSFGNQEKSPNDGTSRATLIVTPKSTIHGWQQQVERHIHAGQMRLMVYHGSDRRRTSSIFWKADIVVTTYETLRLEYAATGPLYSGAWRRVVLDEAHHIRNRSSQIFKATSAVPAKSRWCLTGTPIHNSLDDYGALLSFLGVPLLIEKHQFDFWIASPIKQKRPNSFTILGDLIRATCLRRTKNMVQDSLELPRRTERLEKVELFQADQVLYQFFRDKTAKTAAGLAGQARGASRTSENKGANILVLINILRRICNHGEDLLSQSALDAWTSKSSTSMDWQMMQKWNRICDSCGSDIEKVEESSNNSRESPSNHSICSNCSMPNDNMSNDEIQSCPNLPATQATSENSFGLPKSPTYPSAKVKALMRNLAAEQIMEQHEENSRPIKSIIFSAWTKMLDLVAMALTSHGFRFQRMDGQSTLQQRHVAMQQFNEDLSCTVMLASIGSAGEGVDLTIANNVHIVEPHWSPMAEAQAVDRVHRIGQTREVSVTRYIANDTIETYIQWVQKDKLRLINQSLDSAELLQSDVDDARWKMLQKALNASD